MFQGLPDTLTAECMRQLTSLGKRKHKLPGGSLNPAGARWDAGCLVYHQHRQPALVHIGQTCCCSQNLRLQTCGTASQLHKELALQLRR